MPTVNITADHETGQRTAIVRNEHQMVRVTEHVDGPATCSLVPANPRARCIGIALPEPLPFDHAIAYLSQRMPSCHVVVS